jgi:large subunit ribosomal protein L6
MFKKIIKGIVTNYLKIFTFKNKSIVIFKLSKFQKLQYFILPQNLILIKKKDEINLLSNFKFHFTLFHTWIENLKRPLKKILIFKGRGYKINFINNFSVLSLKIGYSHLLNIPFKKELIKIKLSKNTLVFQSFDYAFVGNFTNKIKQKKLPDSYKGKGIWYKNESKILKELKKK